MANLEAWQCSVISHSGHNGWLTHSKKKRGGVIKAARRLARREETLFNGIGYYLNNRLLQCESENHAIYSIYNVIRGNVGIEAYLAVISPAYSCGVASYQ
jgi:hypothetical protein